MTLAMLSDLFKTFRISTGVFLLLAPTAWFKPVLGYAGGLVEVVLADKLDDSRGFCLDVIGSKQQAKPERGLQAHTCYSYQGKIAVDQAFDADRLPKGEFRMPTLNVCMTLTSTREGSPLALKRCDGRAEQRFNFQPDGEIIPKADPSLCLTVAGGASRPGGGGRPAHLIRRLTLERCGTTRIVYQRWRSREKAD